MNLFFLGALPFNNSPNTTAFVGFGTGYARKLELYNNAFVQDEIQLHR